MPLLIFWLFSLCCFRFSPLYTFDNINLGHLTLIFFCDNCLFNMHRKHLSVTVTKGYFLKKILTLWGCVPLPMGCVGVYNHHLQTSSLIKAKLHVQLLLFLGKNSCARIAETLSHDQDCTTPFMVKIFQNPSPLEPKGQ